MRTFRSDNNSGLCPEARQALVDAAHGEHRIGYGDDGITSAAVAEFHRLFGEDCTVFFVATGTAANTLAVASLTDVWEQVLCHGHSHWNDDESTAPERFTNCRTAPIHTDSSKLTVDDLHRACANARGDVHQPQPGVLTLSNATEFGTVYTPDELRALCAVAHEHGYRVHIDGARFANAVASCDVEPRMLANEIGVDALSFGGTKNGLALGEAVIFFPQGDRQAYDRAVHAFPYHRKGTGHLLSKHWVVSSMFAAVLTDDIWLHHARHANAMAKRLAEGMIAAGIEPRFATDANGIFVTLPDAVHERLQAAGHGYYPFGDASWALYRLMCSFDTSAEDVDALLSDIHAAVRR
ncbi:MAG: aminotransferase class I/II-fold pyridoxal phosphate-dependent enzyme [Planctomycetota bacterium]